jgi:hypothetical protein
MMAIVVVGCGIEYHPGGLATASGLNDNGQIVGSFSDQQHVPWLRQGGTVSHAHAGTAESAVGQLCSITMVAVVPGSIASNTCGMSPG